MSDFDVVIVGSGAGGGIAAYVLASRGFKVGLVEKGRNAWPALSATTLRGSLWGNDELRGRRYFGFHDPFIEPRTFAGEAGGAHVQREVQGLGVGVGGGTVFYDGDCPRLTQLDLRTLSNFGPVAGADVADWPVSYSDLAPFYDATEAEIGIQGLAGADPFAEPRGPYPMPPGAEPKVASLLTRGAKSLGYHPHPMPMAVNSVRYRGRPACVNCGFCHFGCPVNAKSSTAVTAVRDALLTGNCTLLAEHCVTEVLTTPSGERAIGVRVIDPHGAAGTITAGQVILAANGIETPRLLLASASSAHPDGLGNGSGLVGRYLMFHLTFEAIGLFDTEIRPYRCRIVTHALADFTVPDGKPGFIRGGYVELGGQLHPVEEGIRYPWLIHKELMSSGRYRNRIASASMIAEDVPVFENRVELDPTVKDVYGRPVARITYVRHPHDQAIIDRYLPKLEEIANAAGASEVMTVDSAVMDGVPDTKHLMGTTRMGKDPATSVANEWGRLHEVENVWLADGGLWPTSTAFNPTLTQQAMAWRTAAYLADPTDVHP